MSSAAVKERNNFIRRRLFSDFKFYARTVLRIKPKTGGDFVPFILNEAQDLILAEINSQLKERGFVRLLLPKGRQHGCSTFINGYYYWKTSKTKGNTTFILTHRSDTTAALFNMVKNFVVLIADEIQKKFPFPLLPEIGRSNRTEMLFPKLLSGYGLGTAGGEAIGRGLNITNLHLSEPAYYEKQGELAAGLIGAVSGLEDTMIVQESTGAGPHGSFYSLCQAAVLEENKGLWRMLFLPWQIDKANTMDPPEWWEAPVKFKEYQEMHGLTEGQLYWYYLRNQQIATDNGGDPAEIHYKTRREYPAVLEEAFYADEGGQFFSPEDTIRARKANRPPEGYMPLILGIDPNGEGSDHTVAISRQGLNLGGSYHDKLRGDYHAQVAQAANLVTQLRVQVVCIDVTGGGLGWYRLFQLQCPKGVLILPVDFGSGARNKLQYLNRRAELHDTFRFWLTGKGADQPSIPDTNLLPAQMSAYKWGAGECYRGHDGKLQMTAKEKVKKDYLDGRSPDDLDATIVTLALDDASLKRRLGIHG